MTCHIRTSGDAVEKLREGDQRVVLRVLAPFTFAMRWLIPRLWNFSAEHQGIAVQLRQTHSLEDWQDIPFDAAIRTEKVLPEHLRARPIFREQLTLAISPRALDSTGIHKPADVTSCHLLQAATRPGELEAWLSASGLPPSTAAKATISPHFYLALEAALAGAGALVCPLQTVGSLLSKSELTEPLPQIRVPGPVYKALYKPTSARAEASDIFVQWLSRLNGRMAMKSGGEFGAEPTALAS